jgi:hypothetical protein
VSWRAKRATPVSLRDRWRQASRDGETRLSPFRLAELDCVTLDPDYLPPEQRGPALQSVGPLLAQLIPPTDEAGTIAVAGLIAASGPGPAGPAPGDPALAQAAADLEQRGYLRPGDVPPANGTLADELPGWSADPAGGPAPRRVAIGGDLAVITRMRAQPYWVAEALTSIDPTAPDPMGAGFRLVARMYSAYRPPGSLVELPPERDGRVPFAVLWEQRAVLALMAWAGVEIDEMRDPARRAFVEPGPDAPTAAATAGFTSVNCLRVVHPDGSDVMLRSLITATGGGRHWLLEGEHGQRAVRASVDQTGERVDALIQPPGDPAGPDDPDEAPGFGGPAGAGDAGSGAR